LLSRYGRDRPAAAMERRPCAVRHLIVTPMRRARPALPSADAATAVAAGLALC
jgi:hypothetical protein